MKQEDAGNDLHERARRLIDTEWLEGLTAGESRWLAEHLAACQTCAAWAEATEFALRVFRSVSTAPPRGLAATTKLRVRERTAELRQQRARNIALIVGCAFSWLTGVASAPLVWKLCAWLGSVLDVPRLVWQVGFILWWFVPAAVAGLVILWRMRAERENLKLT
jgi:hypothetical protein